MSQIKVDSIIPRGGIPSGSNGGIIQYKYFDNTSVRSTTSNSFVNSTISVTITPQSSDNKIIIKTFGTCMNNNSNSAGGAISIFRGTSTNLSTGVNGVGASYIGELDSNNMEISLYCEFLDSPNTTSSVTYNVFIKRLEGGEFFYGLRGTGAIIAQEVSG
tara:strand:- start:1172 stop:1651 length:480 start_codon:yes stop_codon:yes gene_type:complete